MYYIIASHGVYAQGCKSSCEMITGNVQDFEVVTFTEDMTKESVEKEYEKILQKKGVEDCVAIIADLLGGTPYNAALRIIAEHQKIRLVAGLCQQLLVLLNAGEELDSALKQTSDMFQSMVIEQNEKKQTQEVLASVENNGIVNFRLDERLIHGQVATYWTRTLQAERIMVIDDEILKDEIGMQALKAAVPAGVHLSILTVENAAKRLNTGIYSKQRVFLIVNKTETIVRLLDKGVKVSEVNIGNMGQSEGRRQIKKSVYCTEKELVDIETIEKYGVQVLAQMVPNDEKRTFRSYLK